MMRVDAHQHFWRLADRKGAWPPPQLAPLYRDFYPEDLGGLLRRHGVAATVLVQSLPNEADTHFLLDLSERYSFIGAVVGWADLKAPDAAQRIAALACRPKLRGLRPMLQDLDDDGWIGDPALAAAVAAMRQHGLRFDALVLPRHLPALLAFARRNPQLPIVIDHLAKPAMHSEPDTRWLSDMASLAAQPQVHCKLSGMVTEAGSGWTVAQLQPYARHILQVFGPERVLWGSDWPVLTLAAEYGAWIDASAALLAHLDEAQQRAVFGLNACRFYGMACHAG
ncbi:amidohydrolase [Duganella sp. Root336D2]|uniref:amidohydrolase family protein n=1 Tax=Duganella sp. Root336D2 TaxID=1736518 RepID=UPI000A74E2B6|nr:amidohydrolase family protein [Duganella sp. Root336D2]